MNWRTTGVEFRISSTVPTWRTRPLIEHGDASSDDVGAPHVVGDDDARDAEPVAHANHELVDDGARDRIETRGRLVVQDVLRPERDGPRDADALPHSARQLGGKAVLDAGKIDEIERFAHAVRDLVFGELLLLAESHRDVLADGERVEQRGELEDVADARAELIESRRDSVGTSRSSTMTWPESGSSSPTMCLIATDLPVPE